MNLRNSGDWPRTRGDGSGVTSLRLAIAGEDIDHAGDEAPLAVLSQDVLDFHDGRDMSGEGLFLNDPGAGKRSSGCVVPGVTGVVIRSPASECLLECSV